LNETGVRETVTVTLAEIMADSGYYGIDSTTIPAHVWIAGGIDGADRRALGRSRGSRFTSKLHCLADALGRPLAFLLTPEERRTSRLSPP